MSWSQTCPRCGAVLRGEDRDAAARAVVEHAHVAHGHTVTHERALSHLDWAHPDDADQ